MFSENTINYNVIRIWISFVTHTIIRVIILGYTYNYVSTCTYVLILCYCNYTSNYTLVYVQLFE